MSEKYILDGHEPVPCEDLLEWARWLETADRHVAETHIGTTRISTVFLGLNHQRGSGPPLIFETVIFGGKLNGYQRRCSTWDEAEAQHQDGVRAVRARDQPRSQTETG